MTFNIFANTQNTLHLFCLTQAAYQSFLEEKRILFGRGNDGILAVPGKAIPTYPAAMVGGFGDFYDYDQMVDGQTVPVWRYSSEGYGSYAEGLSSYNAVIATVTLIGLCCLCTIAVLAFSFCIGGVFGVFATVKYSEHRNSTKWFSL